MWLPTVAANEELQNFRLGAIMTTETKINDEDRLSVCPAITLDAKQLARGFYDLFDKNEKTVLRFGMLPAEKMEVLEQNLREEFERVSAKMDGDTRIVFTKEGSALPPYIKFSLKEAVREAMHKITLEIYAIGNLVV